MEKRSWPLKINARTESEFSLRHRVNEEGLIEIFWEVDGALRAGFDHYQIEFSTIDENAHSTYITQRSDFDKCFYADKRYAGEKGNIRSIFISSRKPTVPVRLDRLIWSKLNQRCR